MSDETIHEALQIPDVAESAYRLIELALRGGGPDNVTVVVADVVDYEYGQTQPILAGAVSGDDDQLTLPNTAAGRASAITARKEAVKRVPPQVETVHRPRWSWRRMALVATLVVLLVVAGLFISRAVIRNNYYVAEFNGTVSIMRGIQGSFLGMSLHEPYLMGCLNARNELSQISYQQSGEHLDCNLMKLDDLRPPERAQVQAGLPAGSLDNAIALPRAARHLAAGIICPEHRQRDTRTAQRHLLTSVDDHPDSLGQHHADHDFRKYGSYQHPAHGYLAGGPDVTHSDVDDEFAERDRTPATPTAAGH